MVFANCEEPKQCTCIQAGGASRQDQYASFDAPSVSGGAEFRYPVLVILITLVQRHPSILKQRRYPSIAKRNPTTASESPCEAASNDMQHGIAVAAENEFILYLKCTDAPVRLGIPKISILKQQRYPSIAKRTQAPGATTTSENPCEPASNDMQHGLPITINPRKILQNSPVRLRRDRKFSRTGRLG